jgi:hypothetical protein
MWQVTPTTTWEKAAKHYEKKHPREFGALLRNLERYLTQINGAPNARSVKAGYLHDEPLGIVAIDQKGGGASLQETRMYVYAHEAEKVLYLITIGNKSEQPSDIELSKEFVASLT